MPCNECICALFRDTGGSTTSLDTAQLGGFRRHRLPLFNSWDTFLLHTQYHLDSSHRGPLSLDSDTLKGHSFPCIVDIIHEYLLLERYHDLLDDITRSPSFLYVSQNGINGCFKVASRVARFASSGHQSMPDGLRSRSVPHCMQSQSTRSHNVRHQ
ncbi:uncharacterized protein BP01DRAFT_160922 [Aspergillus saccharolyticus JOP 1030-1]|uniref:Uncharacterized protein n=1 Tax=Aspergillus saccharolyticus JOP 1030-1 TaxID=1450539 RepID=A0A318Z5U4_9EURO|nr:hypothetical protein BP01DRAFT_160922 [Aspergillus saccharolyticus JOP 1030-1]PYH41727.1 hypothetical protein BP01DRAFT_160922 [Aspergillus saccharolyticus JOP 1030-1]